MMSSLPLLLFLLFLLSMPLHSDGVYSVVNQLQLITGIPGHQDHFGNAFVANLDGSAIFLGAPNYATQGLLTGNTPNRVGSVFVFQLRNTLFSPYAQSPQLLPSLPNSPFFNPNTSTCFGSGLAYADPDMLFVGDGCDGNGKIYIFTGKVAKSDAFGARQIIVGSAAKSSFGYAIAATSDQLFAVGAPYDVSRNGSGAVFVYAFSIGGYTQLQVLRSPKGLGGTSSSLVEQFGYTLGATQGSFVTPTAAPTTAPSTNQGFPKATFFLIVGHPYYNPTSVSTSSMTQTGAVYVYSVFCCISDSYAYTFQQTLMSTQPTSQGINFGISVTMSASGNSVFVGNVRLGQVNLFVYSTSTGLWTQSQSITVEGGNCASTTSNPCEFGSGGTNSLFDSDSILMIGAPNYASSALGAVPTGAAYIYGKDTVTNLWSQQQILIGPASNGRFGLAIGMAVKPQNFSLNPLSNTITMLVGAPGLGTADGIVTYFSTAKPAPSYFPTTMPTPTPTLKPTAAPTKEPTGIPTTVPTVPPTAKATPAPSRPTFAPTPVPSQSEPPHDDTAHPTSRSPTTAFPTVEPTRTQSPSPKPSTPPTPRPSIFPTPKPTCKPTTSPKPTNTRAPTKPTFLPTLSPLPPSPPPSPFPSVEVGILNSQENSNAILSSPGAIVGFVLGSIAIIILILVLRLFLFRRKIEKLHDAALQKKQRTPEDFFADSNSTSLAALQNRPAVAAANRASVSPSSILARDNISPPQSIMNNPMHPAAAGGGGNFPSKRISTSIIANPLATSPPPTFPSSAAGASVVSSQSRFSVVGGSRVPPPLPSSRLPPPLPIPGNRDDLSVSTLGESSIRGPPPLPRGSLQKQNNNTSDNFRL